MLIALPQAACGIAQDVEQLAAKLAAAKLDNEGTILRRELFKEIRDGKACYGEHKRFEIKILKGGCQFECGKPS